MHLAVADGCGATKNRKSSNFNATHLSAAAAPGFAANGLLVREMEYIERASFLEIYGLKLAYPISLLSLCFDFSKHTTS